MSSSEIKFDCPECSEGLAIDRRAIGHQVACPFCKDPITVPDIPDPEEISVEPISINQGIPAQSPAAAPSLEDLASSRPEVPAAPPRKKMEQSGTIFGMGESTAPTETSEIKKGGLPPKRKAGETPRVMAEGVDEKKPPGPASVMPSPPSRSEVPSPPGVPSPSSPPRGMAPPVGAGSVPAPPTATRSDAPASRPSQSNGATSTPPEGYEEKVRRKRKRRNPDEHRLNPRERPQMVAFDEVVGDETFRKHPGHGKMPWWKKLGIAGAILGIFAAIGLGMLKHKELNTPDERMNSKELSALEKEFEIAKERMDEFRAAGSVAEKMSFVRAPITQIDKYPSLRERMDDYYGRNTLKAHFPSLDRRSTELVKRGDTEFLKIGMLNKGVESFLYYEKSPAGYALDWDSFVGYNPISWTEFLVNPTGQSEPTIFRLIVEPKEHYTGRFQDEGRYQSYRITDMASSMHAIAYVVRGSTAGDTLEAEFDKLRLEDEKRILIVAEVNLDERGVQGAHLTYIDKVLRTSWLLP